jgi:hypothetical protein
VSYVGDEREESVGVQVLAPQRCRVEVDGDQVATGIGMDVPIYVERVPDDSGQRMKGQENGREEPRECGLVADSVVDLERVRAIEIGRDFSDSI